MLLQHRHSLASKIRSFLDKIWIIICEGDCKRRYAIAPMATNSSEELCIPSTTISFLISCSDHEGERSRGRAPTPSQQVSICAKRWCSPEKKRSRTKASEGLITSYKLGLLCPGFTLVAGFSRRLFPGNFSMAQNIGEARKYGANYHSEMPIFTHTASRGSVGLFYVLSTYKSYL